MPKIVLKPNSAEYANTQAQPDQCACEMPGCPESGDHKAPKHRGLNEYYQFCILHVREYNKAWNFFYGMAEHEVQDHMNKARYGDRPTWQYSGDGTEEDILRNSANAEYHHSDSAKQEQSNAGRYSGIQHSGPEMEALALMGLEPPIDLDEIKKRYKEMAKKYHPDLNQGCKKSEEVLKHINMAYTILKLAYSEYDKLLKK